MWGSNARDTHPIFFHHVLKALRNGARSYVVDPRRTSSAQWADVWLGLDVGTDVALANAVGREIIAQGRIHRDFIENATTGFDDYRAAVEPYTLKHAEQVTGVPGDAIRDLAHAYASAKNAQLCWTLGITEHHNAVDNVLALINLSLLTGHVGRPGSGLNPLRGQNNVQGGGDMGAIPNKLPGFQDVENDELRGKFERAWNCTIPPKIGWHLTLMFEAMERRDLRGLYVIGENPAQSEANVEHAIHLMQELDHLVVQDIFLTKTAELADVVLPAAAGWAEAEGTVTSSERRVQRVRKALDPPGEARDDVAVLCDLARRFGHDWGTPTAEEIWDELRGLSPMHGGMSYARLEALGGIQWPCPDEDHPGSPYLHGRLWKRPAEGRLAPFSVVEHIPPADELTDEYPVRLTSGRRLDSYNTGVQSGGFNSPIRHAETLDICEADGERWAVADGARVLVSSRRGAIEMTVRYADGLRPGLAFTTFHFPDEAATNKLTNDTWDRKSGTADFKATAIRIEQIAAVVGAGG